MSWQAVKAAIGHRCPSATAKAVLLVIAEHAHEDGTGSCPKVSTIAEESDAHERTVRHVIEVLVEGGVLSADESAGRRGWAVNMGDPVDLRGVAMRKEPAPSPAKPAPSPTAPSPTKPAPSPTKPAPSPGPSEPPGTTNKPSGRDRVPPSLVGTDRDPAFVEFWSTYPLRKAKGQARRAWRTAVKSTDPSEIIAGAARYRDSPNRSEQFTAHPATWLNGERWDDDDTVRVARPEDEHAGLM